MQKEDVTLLSICSGQRTDHSFCRPASRIALAIAGAAAGVVFSIYFYLAIYLEYIARIRLSWSVYAPNMIPAATGAGLVSGIRCV